MKHSLAVGYKRIFSFLPQRRRRRGEANDSSIFRAKVIRRKKKNPPRSCSSSRVQPDGNLCLAKRTSNIQQLILTSLTDRDGGSKWEKKSHQKFIPLDHYLDYANTPTPPSPPKKKFLTHGEEFLLRSWPR